MRLIVFLFFLNVFVGFGQQTDTAIVNYLPYQILSNGTDEMSPVCLDIYFDRSDVFYLLNASYFVPKFAYLEGSVGPGGVKASVQTLLFSKRSTKKAIFPVRQNLYQGDSYGRVKDNYHRKRYFGLHGGIAYKDFTKRAGFLKINLRGVELAAGIGMFSGRYVKLKNKKNQIGILKYTWSVYADLLYYSNITYPFEDRIKKNEPYGFRMETQMRWMSNYHVGFLAKIGGGYYTKWYPILGFGFLSFF